MVGREKELKIRFVPGRCELVEEDIDIPSRRVLITGATGLLGRAVFKEFNENNWNAVGCGYRRAQPKFEQVNLLNSVAVHDIIHDFQSLLLRIEMPFCLRELGWNCNFFIMFVVVNYRLISSLML
uniref:Methionine adenosyltransferase 2 subunit beta n=1 Tax=Pavo cristatus TaxID=9049 RepID=A0A8C9EW77_PAVCR